VQQFVRFQVVVLRAVDQSALSIDHAAPSRDLLLARWIALRYRWMSTGQCFQVALSMDRPDLFIEVSQLTLLKNQLAPILPV